MHLLESAYLFSLPLGVAIIAEVVSSWQGFGLDDIHVEGDPLIIIFKVKERIRGAGCIGIG